MRKFFRLLLSGLCVSLMPVVVFAVEPNVIQIEEPWARESPPTATSGAAYMTLVNTGHEADRLLSATGDVAATIELHTHLIEDNVMKMRKIEAIEVAPGEPTALRPGGLHVMLIGLKKPLAAGQTFPLTLKFEKAGETAVQVKVRGKDAGVMPAGHAHPQ